MVQHKVLPDGTTQPDLTPCSQAQGEKKDILRRLMGKAKEDWKAADHPNWSIRDMDSADFLDSHLQPGQVGSHQSPASGSHLHLRLMQSRTVMLKYSSQSVYCFV